MDVMSSVDELDADTMITEMLKHIRDRSQFRLSINRREARYKICACFKQRQVEWKGELLSTKKRGKDSHKVFKAVVNEP